MVIPWEPACITIRMTRIVTYFITPLRSFALGKMGAICDGPKSRAEPSIVMTYVMTYVTHQPYITHQILFLPCLPTIQ